MENPGQREGYNLEYRDKVDDSWYSVRLVLKDQRLTVKYEGYPVEVDTIFDAGNFTSKEEVDEFVERFRCVSPQLQDSECCTLKEGMIVCVACNAFGEDDMLFYDAVIEAGINSAKSIVGVTTGATESKYSRDWEQDEDLGGLYPSSHLMLIENLERNLLPSSFRDFIYENTSVSSEVYIFPSLSMPYARSIIVVDCEVKLQKIHKFLENPAHLVVSSTGRPLVITERDTRHDTINKWSGSFGYGPQDTCLGTSSNKDLMVVHSGTEAYKRAKQLKDLFLEFTSHLKQLYTKFSVEEMMILQTQQQFNQSSIHRGVSTSM